MPHHAWGYAVAEIEVHGGGPLSTSILYEDLTRRAARVVGARLKRTRVGPLERAPWIEALGWFGGWDYVRKLAHEQAVQRQAGERTTATGQGTSTRRQEV